MKPKHIRDHEAKLRTTVGGARNAEEYQRVVAAHQPPCETCEGRGIVSTPWPSGYPHAFPCPACKPNTPCECKLANCPGPERAAEWKAAHPASPQSDPKGETIAAAAARRIAEMRAAGHKPPADEEAQSTLNATLHAMESDSKGVE